MTRVLYVDDEEDIRTIVEFALRLDPAMECRLAGSAAAARAILAEGWAPDILLVDVMMPEEDGVALLAWLRRQPGHAGIPVVFVTASAQARETTGYLTAGAAGVIRKPFDPLELVQSIRGYLA